MASATNSSSLHADSPTTVTATSSSVKLAEVLKAALLKRGLATSGNLSELAHRLPPGQQIS